MQPGGGAVAIIATTTKSSVEPAIAATKNMNCGGERSEFWVSKQDYEANRAEYGLEV